VTRIHSMQYERGELSSKVRRSLPHLDLRSMGRSDEPGTIVSSLFNSCFDCARYSLAIRRELDVSDWLLEVEVVEHSRPLEVDQDRTTIYAHLVSSDPHLPYVIELTLVYTDEHRLIWRESNASNILSVFERERPRLVAAGMVRAPSAIAPLHLSSSP
jgi:hypothetical protein